MRLTATCFSFILVISEPTKKDRTSVYCMINIGLQENATYIEVWSCHTFKF